VSYLNANIPPIYCKIRKEYLYDLDPKYKNESEECIIFGIASIAGRAILFTLCYRMVRSIIDCLSQRFSKTFS
jgi:hypothetical protein